MLETLYQHISQLQTSRFLIAYSGGLDSQALLHAVIQLKKQHNFAPTIEAIHVNHHINSQADSWQQHCQDYCQEHSVKLHTSDVVLEQGSNIEAQARQARFDAFKSVYQQGDVLLVAHHLQDQAETFLYRLMRGAGVQGLSAMQAQQTLFGMRVVKPLLNCSKTQLQNYAKEEKLKWVEDDSNNSIAFDRNYLRHKVLPILTARWPKAPEKISHAVAHLQQAQSALSELAEIDLATIEHVNTAEFLKPAFIDLNELQRLSVARQYNVLRFWLQGLGITISQAKLEQVFQMLIPAAEDAQPLIKLSDAKGTLRRYQHRLYLQPKLPEVIEATKWHALDELECSNIELSLKKSVDVELSVKPRQQGEVILLAGKHKQVKKLLQEKSVPPWLRDMLPFIYCNDDLIAIADIVYGDIACEKLGQDNSIIVQ